MPLFYSFLFSQFKKVLPTLIFFSICTPIYVFSKEKGFKIDQSYLNTQSDIFYLKGETALYRNQTKDALDFFLQSLSYAPNSFFIREKIAQIYVKENLFAEAIREYELILSSNHSFYRAREALAQIYAVSDLQGVALKEYRILASQNSKDFMIQIQKATVLLNSEKWQMALKEFQALESFKMPKSRKLELHLAQAYIYKKLGLSSQREKQIHKAEGLIVSVDSLFKIVKFLEQEEDYSKATFLLQKYQDKEDFTIPVTKQLFSIYQLQGQREQSTLQLMKLRKQGALETDHYFELALFFIEQENSDEAISFLKDFLIASPNSHISYYLMGALQEKEKHFNEALEAYQKIPPDSFYFTSTLLRMSQIHYQAGDAEKALSLLKPFIFKSKNQPEPLLLYSQLLWEKGNAKASLKILNKGLQVFHQHPEILFLKGVYSYKKTPRISSLKDIKEVLKQQPHHSEALNFLAYSYAQQNTHLNEAEEFARKALSLKPHSSLFLDTMGWVLYKKGLFKASLSYLKKAFDENKAEKSIVEHLAKTYHQLGDFKKSDFFFKKSLELGSYESNSKESFNFFTQSDF